MSRLKVLPQSVIHAALDNGICSQRENGGIGLLMSSPRPYGPIGLSVGTMKQRTHLFAQCDVPLFFNLERLQG